MASDHRMRQAGDQSFLQKPAGARIKNAEHFRGSWVLHAAWDPNSLLTCRAFFPQEQGLKANNSKELSMCFTEVSRGTVGGEGWALEAGPTGTVI